MQNNNSMMDEATPLAFHLSQNYPNPFSEKTTIKYCVAYKTRVQVSVYNTEGEEIEKLVDEEKKPGTYEVEFSTGHFHESLPDGKAGGNLPDGYYFYRMIAGDYSSEKKWLCINKLSGRLNMKSLLQSLFFFLMLTQIGFAQAPIISVTPDSLSENLLSGKTSEQTLIIYNNGGSDLTFEINVKENLSSLLLNAGGDYSITSSTQPLETTDMPIKNYKSYSGNSISLDEYFILEKNEKIYKENTLAGGLKILLVTSGGYPSEIKDALLSFPDIQQVDIFDALSSTPTLSQVLPYHTIIAMDNSPYADPVAMGNVLADYVDAGRGLILTVATFASGWEIMGRLLDDEYFPFNIGYGPAGAASLGTFNPGHPIMQGVTAAYGDLLVDLTLANGAELVASWDTGWPLVATKGKNVVAVNSYVTEPGGWTGDIPLILHNAAFWAGSCSWLSAEPDNGTVPAGTSINITMNFNTAGLSGGEYNANIVFSSNDPVTPELIVPAHLIVTDAPAIYTETNSINFGEVFLGVTDTFYLEVRNMGSQDLLIFSATIQPTTYTVYPTFAGIDPGESEIFTITFAPQIVGNYPGTLTFSSNDPLYGNYVLNISGQGVEPPVIVVNPDSLVVGVLPGSTRTKILTISNQGESNLYFILLGGFSSTNYALQFNGASTYVECADNSSLNIRYSMTVEAWIFPFDWNGNRRILQKEMYDNQYRFESEEGHFWFQLASVNNGNIFTDLPSTNNWHHCAGVYNYDANIMQLFIDGIKVKENLNVSGQINTSSDPLYIGTKYPGAPSIDHFNGIIDEIRMWNIARSESDIPKYMNQQLTGTEPGLAAYWRFDEGTGNTTFDLTTNANHGSLNGGVTWVNSTAPLIPGWFFVNTDSGVCAAHSYVDIELLFDATELDTGDYYASIIVKSNDPFTPSVVVPIHMIVSTSVGVDEVLNTPLVFNLEQNFPNPFNPSTTIKYSIPELSKVKLTLFNLLGEEVMALVNEEMVGGNYSVEFNAANLPSGVYFYQLLVSALQSKDGKAGSLIQTKKMLLLK